MGEEYVSLEDRFLKPRQRVELVFGSGDRAYYTVGEYYEPKSTVFSFGTVVAGSSSALKGKDDLKDYLEPQRGFLFQFVPVLLTADSALEIQFGGAPKLGMPSNPTLGRIYYWQSNPDRPNPLFMMATLKDFLPSLRAYNQGAADAEIKVAFLGRAVMLYSATEEEVKKGPYTTIPIGWIPASLS